MTTGLTIMLLLMGVVLVADAYNIPARAYIMDWIALLGKAVGGTLGSSVAIIFKPGGGWHSIVSRFVIGLIMGVIFAPVLRDWMGWPPTLDYWAASAASCGMTGYLILQILYSEEISLLIKRKLTKTDIK